MTIEMNPIQQAMLTRFSELASVADEPTIAPNLNMQSASQTDAPFASVLNTINDQQNDAATQMQAIETGMSDDLVGAMLSTQKASLSFSALVQVRNKVISGFDDIMTMSL